MVEHGGRSVLRHALPERSRRARARRSSASSSSGSSSSCSRIRRVPERCGDWADRGADLRAGRARIHARLRDPAAHQLRARRRVHAVGARCEHADHQRGSASTRTRAVPAVIGAVLLVLLVTMPGFAVVNAVIERIAYRPLRNAPRARAADHRGRGVVHPPEHRRWRCTASSFQTIPDCIPQGDAFSIGGVAFTVEQARGFALVITVPAWPCSPGSCARHDRARRCGPSLRTRTPSAMMGINVNRTISVTFMLAGALAAAAGTHLLPPVQHALRHRLRARAHRVHRRRPRRDRKPARRRARGALDRPHPVVQRGPRSGTRRAATGRGRSSSGSSSRRSSSGRRACSASARRRAHDLDRRRAAVRHRRRGHGRIAPGARGLRAALPVRTSNLHDLPLIGDFVPATESMVVMVVVHDDGARAQHRRRLRRAARPRLRRVLRGRRVHRRLVRVAAVRPGELPFLSSGAERRARASTSPCGSFCSSRASSRRSSGS